MNRIAQIAELLECDRSAVLRMIAKGYIRADMTDGELQIGYLRWAFLGDAVA
ncbi:MAG: hypothetical protein V2J02_08065 [Pseudomonadales bacterium]|nr:hypothetical protein [Pseudomonadales bacterium]